MSASKTWDLLTVKEVAQLLRVSIMTIHRAIRRQEMNALRIGHEYRIERDEFESYLIRRGTSNGEAAK